MSKIHLIDVATDNVTDYKETSLFLVFPYCSGKCGEECQNKDLRKKEVKEFNTEDIIKFYQSLDTHNAVVCGGLEPWDSFEELKQLVEDFARSSSVKPVDFVIYTGYDNLIKYYFDGRYREVKEDFFDLLQTWINYADPSSNLIIKQGKYDINRKTSWHSDVLGVDLATNNQEVLVFDYQGNLIRHEMSKPYYYECAYGK